MKEDDRLEYQKIVDLINKHTSGKPEEGVNATELAIFLVYHGVRVK